MSHEQPRIRPLELVPLNQGGQATYALRDPYGFTATVAVPAEVAALVTLMNGERSCSDLQHALERQLGKSMALADVERVVQQLDECCLLDNQRSAEHQAVLVEQYQQLAVRPAVHAGGAYASDEVALRTQLGDLFTCPAGPGLLPAEGHSREALMTDPRRLCAVMSPHIDLHRGGPTFAWAYDRVAVEADADVFVILGTAHTPLASFFSVSRKDFATPLGVVPTQQEFVADLEQRLAARLDASEADRVLNDEMPHRNEHSIEFQTLMLQYVLGERRDFSIVPILVGSFHPFVDQNRSPGDAPAVAEFIAALRDTVDTCGKKVCFIAGVDLAHIGQQFGDQAVLDQPRLQQQWTDDQQLLARACEGDAEAWFIHVAAQADSNRICGLAPTYVMLRTIHPCRGELLKYDQAVAEDGTSCVSFASVAFYV